MRVTVRVTDTSTGGSEVFWRGEYHVRHRMHVHVYSCVIKRERVTCTCVGNKGVLIMIIVYVCITRLRTYRYQQVERTDTYRRVL